MIATATALIQATEESIFDDEAMGFAQFITHSYKELDDEQLAKALFVYATMLTSTAVDKATKVLLSETQVKELMATIDEMDSLRNEVLGGE
jgi:Arc/MetJ family transcription regulator